MFYPPDPLRFFIGYYFPEKMPDILKAVHGLNSLVKYAPGKRQVQEIPVPRVNADFKDIEKGFIFRVYVFKFRLVSGVPPGGEDPEQIPYFGSFRRRC
jgi:hypothetical protein